MNYMAAFVLYVFNNKFNEYLFVHVISKEIFYPTNCVAIDISILFVTWGHCR